MDKIDKIELVPRANPSEIVRFNVSPILLDASNYGYLLTGTQMKISNDWDKNLHKILKGTYKEVGIDFFKSITQGLAKTLGMSYAFIAEVKDFKSKKLMVNTITFWNKDKLDTNFKYSLAGSPCENVVDKKQIIISDNVSTLFPNDKDLINLGVQSYIGTPVYYKDGTAMGLVVVMDTKPIKITEDEAYKLTVFANRIGIEMEWFKNDEQLKEQEQKLRAILKSLPNPVYVQNTDGIYQNCNDAFLNYFKLKEKDIIDQKLDKLPKIIKENTILSLKHNEKTKGINRIQTRIITGDATTKESIVIKSPITDGRKKLVGIVGVIQDISEMKDAEKLLHLNEEKYRTLFNEANDAFFLMGNNAFIDCNPKALEIFGCSKEKIIGSTPQQFSPLRQPDKQLSTTKAFKKINEAINGESKPFNWTHKKFNGRLFDAEVSLNAFHIKGELLIQAMVRDVSDKQKATRDIEKQTLRMKEMYALTSDMHIDFDEKVSNILKMATESLGMQLGGISKVKGEHYEMTNFYSSIPFSVEEIIFLSQTYCSITIEENRLVAIPNFGKSDYSNREVFKLMRLESYIGVPYWVRGELRGTIFFTSFYHVQEFKSYDSDFVQIIAQWIGSSIERKEYEESLLKKQALLDTLLRDMPVDFSVRDPQLNMLWQSNKSKAVWGDNEGKPINFSDVNKESATKWKNIFRGVLNGETIRGENKVKIYGKQYLLYSIASPIKVNGKVEQITIIHIDISQLKKAEKKLKTQNTKLKKLNAELDRFVYSASHDLRAPLSSLLGLIDLSQREELSPALNQYLELMNNSITRLDSFISDITDYSRNLRLKTKNEKIDFNVLVDEIFSSLAFMSAEKINLSLKIEGDNNFNSDADRLKLILSNLISNSIRYKSHDRKPRIKVEVAITKDKAIFKIIDNGIGIPKKYQSKIFEMFYRANDQNTGSGLGLFIVRETVDKLKGKIELESEIGKGTTISIILPNSSH
ncbi:MAG: PAS domain S-box protein [Cyclobacteriaceae bacterium]|nr:PAS domain S-box protein [Cyclobacteriaceae bacterium]